MLLTNRRPRRKGTVTVLVAVSLIGILSITALSLDGGMLLDKRRQAQTASDAAALAAAADLYYNWWANKGLDPNGTAKASARAAAEAAGFVHGQNGCTVDVYIPPQSGKFVNKSGHVEVIITSSQQRYFSKMFGTADVVYGARAVSRGRRSGINNAILVLDPSGQGSLSAGGTNATFRVTGGPVQVNSNNSAAIVANNGSLTAPEFDVVGVPGYSIVGSGTINGTIKSNVEPVPDPLASLPPPDPSTMTIQSTKKMTIAGGSTTNLQPGVYIGGIDITGKGNVNLAPGVYYMQGGGLSWSGQGNFTGAGVMIYNAPTSKNDVISLAGTAQGNLTPPTSGPYQGITIFQDRNSTTPMSVTGNGQLTMSGTLYAASALLTVAGNGAVNLIGAQYISYDLKIDGNGIFDLSWNANITPGSRDILLVE